MTSTAFAYKGCQLDENAPPVTCCSTGQRVIAPAFDGKMMLVWAIPVSTLGMLPGVDAECFRVLHCPFCGKKLGPRVKPVVHYQGAELYYRDPENEKAVECGEAKSGEGVAGYAQPELVTCARCRLAPAWIKAAPR